MKKAFLLFFLLINSALAEPGNPVGTISTTVRPQAHPQSASSASVSTLSEGLSGSASHAANQHAQYMEKRLADIRAGAYTTTSSSSNVASPSEVTRQQIVDLSKVTVNRIDAASLIRSTTSSASRRTIDLNSIPDPSSVPYRFQSSRGELVRLYTDLYKIQPQFTKQQTAKSMGLQAVEGADQSYAAGDQESGQLYHDIALGMLDVAIGLDPITGVTRSTYELISGKNFVTGVPLSNLERTFAFIGVVTAGQSRNVQKIGGVLLKVANHSATVQPIIRAGERLAVRVGEVAHGFIKCHRITHIEKGVEANTRLGLSRPPYDLTSRVVHFVTTKGTKWIRVHNNLYPDRPGRWIVKSGELKGLTPLQIADKLNLPSLPTHYSVIILPKDVKMSRGMTHLNQWENGLAYTQRGQVQYRIESETLDAAWYSAAKTLPTGGL